jgi:hypothetical protein
MQRRKTSKTPILTLIEIPPKTWQTLWPKMKPLLARRGRGGPRMTALKGTISADAGKCT